MEAEDCRFPVTPLFGKCGNGQAATSPTYAPVFCNRATPAPECCEKIKEFISPGSGRLTCRYLSGLGQRGGVKMALQTLAVPNARNPRRSLPRRRPKGSPTASGFGSSHRRLRGRSTVLHCRRKDMSFCLPPEWP